MSLPHEACAATARSSSSCVDTVQVWPPNERALACLLVGGSTSFACPSQSNRQASPSAQPREIDPERFRPEMEVSIRTIHLSRIRV